MAQVRKLEARERSYAKLMEPLYKSAFPNFVEAMREDFYRQFALIPGDKPAVPQVMAASFAAEWTSAFDDTLDLIEEEWSLGMDEEIADAHDEGYMGTLYLLGLQDEDLIDDLPAEDRKPPSNGLAFALAASFAGLTFYARARMWHVNATEKVRQQVKALAVTGDATWPAIHEILTRVTREYRNGLDALAADELYLARLHGEQRALDVLPLVRAGRLKQLWVTRDDERVCQRCGPLHLTWTQLVPILDTHPRCRCILIPLIPRRARESAHPVAAFG